MGRVNKSISVNSLSLVDPESDKMICLLDGLLLGCEQTLENICQVAHVEFVVEILCSFSEGSLDFSV
jgi:hypothetical protein